MREKWINLCIITHPNPYLLLWFCSISYYNLWIVWFYVMGIHVTITRNIWLIARDSRTVDTRDTWSEFFLFFYFTVSLKIQCWNMSCALCHVILLRIDHQKSRTTIKTSPLRVNTILYVFITLTSCIINIFLHYCSKTEFSVYFKLNHLVKFISLVIFCSAVKCMLTWIISRLVFLTCLVSSLLFTSLFCLRWEANTNGCLKHFLTIGK